MLNTNMVWKIIQNSDLLRKYLVEEEGIVSKSCGLAKIRPLAAFSYCFVWEDTLSREELTDRLVKLKFDNLTVIEIVYALVRYKNKMTQYKMKQERA